MNANENSSAGAGLEPMVFEGELVSPEENAALDRRVAASKAVAVVRVARTVVTHERTKSTVKAVLRHSCFPIAGAGVVVKRWRDTHGANRYERLMRQAEIVGDKDMLLEWEARDVAEKQRRHQRVMDWVKSPLVIAKAVAISIASLAGLLLVLGVILAVADDDVSRVLDPIIGVISVVRWCAWFIAAYGALMLLVTTGCVVAYLWNTGRKHTEPLVKWAAPTETRSGRDVVPDETRFSPRCET